MIRTKTLLTSRFAARSGRRTGNHGSQPVGDLIGRRGGFVRVRDDDRRDSRSAAPSPFAMNDGTTSLSLDPNSLLLPAGFSVVTPFTSSVAVGASTTFTIRLDATAVGSFQGNLSLASNDADENPFEFSLQGEVLPPQPEIVVRYGDSPESQQEVLDGFGARSWVIPRWARPSQPRSRSTTLGPRRSRWTCRR